MGITLQDSKFEPQKGTSLWVNHCKKFVALLLKAAGVGDELLRLRVLGEGVGFRVGGRGGGPGSKELSCSCRAADIFFPDSCKASQRSHRVV